MHILFVAKHYFGNPDVVRLSTELAKRRHRISVVTCIRDVDKCTSVESVNIFESKPLITIHSLAYPLSFPFSKIYKIVQKQRVDLIYALNDFSTNTFIAAAVSRLTNVPLVYKIQGLGSATNSLFVDAVVEVYANTVERIIAARAERVILDSKLFMSEARRLGIKQGNIVIIPFGVDCNYLDPERPDVKRKAALLRDELNIGDDIVVGYVGRLVPVKGLGYFISAVKLVQKEYPNIILLVVGDGPERQNLERMVKDLEVRAIFVGWQADAFLYYALMDIFVLPSLSEGLPNVMLEAMAMRKSIVATEVGMNADIIVGGKSGFLVPVRDPRSIASALVKLVENNGLRRCMGVINRQIVKKTFSWERIVPEFEKLYDDVYADEN